jgi:hypothetical protein
MLRPSEQPGAADRSTASPSLRRWGSTGAPACHSLCTSRASALMKAPATMRIAPASRRTMKRASLIIGVQKAFQYSRRGH